MKLKLFLILLLSLIFFLRGAGLALGFGVSPPRVFNDHLVPGAHFEQTIVLTQATPEKPLGIEVEIEAPTIKDWIKIDPGKQFTIPTGMQQFPMKVIIDVPKDAAYENYEGDIIVKALTGGGGQVAILTGGIVQIKLRVSGEEFSDFVLRGIRVPKIEEGSAVRVEIELENIGNVKIRPSRVYLEIHDQYRQKLLVSGELTDMNWVDPFKVGKVIGKMPTKLGIGEYWVSISIFKKGELALKDERNLQIVEKGTLGKIFGLDPWVFGLIVGGVVAGILSIKFGLWKKILGRFGINIKIERVQKVVKTEGVVKKESVRTVKGLRRIKK